MENTIRLYGNTVYGAQVSDYGLKTGYLDYRTLARLVGGCILNNSLRNATGTENWELITGEEYLETDDEIIYHDVYQDYIISEDGYRFLSRYTDEMVVYNEELDVYLWLITHFGTSWDYVLTDIKLVKERD